jgi:hypothetical protein
MPMTVRGASQNQQRPPTHNSFRQPVFPNMFPPGQQEMMAQMMMMQASMAQMGEMMNHMIQVRVSSEQRMLIANVEGKRKGSSCYGSTQGQRNQDPTWHQTRLPLGLGGTSQSVDRFDSNKAIFPAAVQVLLWLHQFPVHLLAPQSRSKRKNGHGAE